MNFQPVTLYMEYVHIKDIIYVQMKQTIVEPSCLYGLSAVASPLSLLCVLSSSASHVPAAATLQSEPQIAGGVGPQRSHGPVFHRDQ